MKKHILFFCFLVSTTLSAQVGINTTDPHAQFEIKSSNQANPEATDGILIPKVDAFPAINPTVDQDGMMVYLTTDVGANLKGFYYWDNTNSIWKSVSGDKGWSLTGNAGTDVITNFIGTTDNTGLKFKVNNLQAGYIDPVLYNTSFGQVAANSITTGYRNVAFGTQSLSSNTTGYYNSAVGFQSLASNTSGADNHAFGTVSLGLNTTGSRNSAFGGFALNRNTIGNDNTSVGYFSMLDNTTGSQNTAVGVGSLASNITGAGNVASGYNSLYSNTTGGFNVANGFQALQNNSTGSYNVAIGLHALLYNTTGDFNIAVGSDALVGNTTGLSNTAIGFQSLNNNSTGSNNTANGLQCLYSNTSGNNNVANGMLALYSNTTGNNNTANGYQSLYRNNTGYENVANGYQSLYSNTSGNYNVASGYQSLYSNTTGSDNIANGYKALYVNSTGNFNLANGHQALFNNSTGSRNVAYGHFSINGNNGNGNVAFGHKALMNNSTGTGNGGFGEEANPTTTTGWNNIGIGFHALGNVAPGYIGGARITGNEIGFDNIGLGLSAGDRSGNNINGCLFLGAFANVTFNDSNLTNATAIGRYATVNQNNTIVLGGINGINNAPSSAYVGIGTTTPSCPLNVVGSNTQFGSWAFYARSGSSTTTGYAGGTSGNFSIIASDRIQATEFNAVSDERIKNIQSRMDSKNALEKVNQLQVTNYTYKYWLQKGTAIKTGFIAQEVEKIIPSAVNQTTNFIPNIMQVPHAFCVDTLKNTISVNLAKPIHIKKDEKIRLYNNSTSIESEAIVIDDYNFEIIIPASLKTDDLFVYGTQVTDFRSVDYDQIHTLSVAAIQELSNENELLKQKIQQLENKNNTTEERLQKLETTLTILSSK